MTRLARIGLTTYREQAAWGVWDEPADLLPRSYADAVAAAGGVPMLLPPVDSADLPRRADTVLDGLDGLIVAGGADVDPGRYGEQRNPRTGPARPDRDSWEVALVRAAVERAMPVLGICRGMQVLNVALGGTLVQHLPDVVGHDGHCPTPGVHARHSVTVEPGSMTGALLGPSCDVATYHHQAVAMLAPGLVATAWADDGTVEAIERPDGGWVVGVQWHPEVFDGAALFAGLVQACLARVGDGR